MIPSSVMKPRYERMTIRPTTTPITPSGMVMRMISGRRSELNWPTSSRTMISPAIGSCSMIEALALADSSSSPPSSQP